MSWLKKAQQRWFGAIGHKSPAIKASARRRTSLELEELEGRIVPAVDLKGDYTQATDVAQWGQNIAVTSRIRNAGATRSGDFQVQWYLSRDSIGSSDDLLLYQTAGGPSYYHPRTAGASSGAYFTVDLQLPAAQPSGWSGSGFYLIMKTDATRQVRETNEANNFGKVGNGYDRDPIAITTGAEVSANWFDQNVSDPALRSVGREGWSDFVLDRADMLAVFSQIEQDGIVSATEFSDLKHISAAATYLRLPDYVANLAGKAINGDRANQWYHGATLGNLTAGSSASQLSDLVGKWFLGEDRPVARSDSGVMYAYQQAAGKLFVNGVSYQDVHQGAVGDCYFVAALASLATRSPGTIENMFIDNGDNTYTVRFYKNGVADYVSVDRYLPVNGWGRFAFANQGDWIGNAGNELWVALAEKAYVQLNESGWIGQDGINSYQGIAGGWSGDVFRQLLGRAANAGQPMPDQTTFVNAFNAGRQIVLASISDPNPYDSVDIVNRGSFKLVYDHAYAVVGYDAASQRFLVFNPWGIQSTDADGLLRLTWSEIQANFRNWCTTAS